MPFCWPLVYNMVHLACLFIVCYITINRTSRLIKDVHCVCAAFITISPTVLVNINYIWPCGATPWLNAFVWHTWQPYIHDNTCDYTYMSHMSAWCQEVIENSDIFWYWYSVIFASIISSKSLCQSLVFRFCWKTTDIRRENVVNPISLSSPWIPRIPSHKRITPWHIFGMLLSLLLKSNIYQCQIWHFGIIQACPKVDVWATNKHQGQQCSYSKPQ